MRGVISPVGDTNNGRPNSSLACTGVLTIAVSPIPSGTSLSPNRMSPSIFSVDALVAVPEVKLRLFVASL